MDIGADHSAKTNGFLLDCSPANTKNPR